MEEIDLKQPENVVLEKVRRVCTSTGFTILRNHGISQELLDAALANCEALFSLPQEKKESLQSDAAFTVSHQVKYFLPTAPSSGGILSLTNCLVLNDLTHFSDTLS